MTRHVHIPINKPAFGIRGLDLTVDADPETGRVSLRLGGAPFPLSGDLDPEELRKIGLELVAEGERGMSYQGACVGLKRECGNCNAFIPDKAVYRLGKCAKSMCDTVERTRGACPRWRLVDDG
jgi:hypothetical protein